MKRASLVLITLGCAFSCDHASAAAKKMPPALSQMPSNAKVILTIQAPITISETSEPGLMKIDTSKSDLEMKLWQVGQQYGMESAIDVRNVNQSVLPTDEHGHLLKEVTSLGQRPFIRYYVPGRDPETIDVKCDRKRCRAVWKNPPYETKKSKTFQVEVNIRGLRGKHWTAGFNQALIRDSIPLFELSEKHGFPKRTSYFDSDGFWPDPLVSPLQPGNAKLSSMEDWNFEAGEMTSTGYRRHDKLTRYSVLQGRVALAMTNEGFLEKRELSEGDLLWLLPGQIAQIESSGTPPQEARLVRLEFEKAAP